MRTQQNLITDLNTITQGLNFLVPQFWWNNFFARNQYIRSFQQMKLEGTSPLDFLYEVGITTQQPTQLRQSFSSIFKDAESSLKMIKGQLKQAESVKDDEFSGKRNRVGCSWLQGQYQLREQECDMLLYSPEVRQEMVDLFQMGQESWVLVAPELYRQIWLKYLQISNSQRKNQLIAIPTILNQTEIQLIQQMGYHPSFINKHHLEVFFKNYSGYSFAFRGYIDAHISLQELVKYLDDGLFRLIGGSKMAKSLEEYNMLLVFSNFTFTFYDFQTEQLTENLEWVPFQQIKKNLLKGSHIHQINIFASSYSFRSHMEPENQDGWMVNIQSVSKRRKGDFTVCNPDEVERPRAGTRPIVREQLADNEKPKLPATTIDVHSSTQEQTPFQPRKINNLIIVQKTIASPTAIKTDNFNPNSTPNSNYITPKCSERINYPLWKQGHQIQKLIKYAQLKISIPKILLPYGDQSIILLKEKNKKVMLPKRTNQLIINQQMDQQGQLKQKYNAQPEFGLEDQQPSESVARQLQILALSIQGIKMDEGLQVGQKMQVGNGGKCLSENQSKTCKNQLMDQLDIEESREF